jgi:hypothetical protein
VSEPWKAVLVVVIVASAWLAFVEVPRRKWTVKLRSNDSRASQPVTISKGGAGWLWWVFYGRASWPLVRIEVHDWGIRVTANHRAMRWYIPTAELSWECLRPIRTSGQSFIIRLADTSHGFLRLSPHDTSLIPRIEAIVGPTN